MRLAIISDIHGNWDAFQAVLKNMDRAGVDAVVCLGDNIGYGPEPNEVIAALQQRNIPSVLGNHELAFLQPERLAWFNPTARQSLSLTFERLSEGSRSYISRMEAVLVDHGCRFVHGFPPDSISTYLFQATDHQIISVFNTLPEPISFVGHTHVIEMISFDGRTVMHKALSEGTVRFAAEQRHIINVGSVGQPRDGDTRASFAVVADGRAEIHRVPYDFRRTQAKILRVLEEKQFERVGGGEKIQADVRIIAATNRNLPKEVEAGRFRDDLYFRLNVFPILVPALRDRKEDILPIADHFAGEICAEHGKERKTFTREAMERLLDHTWPGNVRELRNVVERLVILSTGPAIGEETVARVLAVEPRREETQPPSGFEQEHFRDAVLAFEKEFLTRKLRENDFHISRTAEKLGLDRTSIHRKMKQLAITPEGGRR